MEITNLFFSRREEALLSGDYNSYRAQTSRRIHTVRKKLGHTTPKGRKYATKAPITAENVGADTGYTHLLILNAERAWAQAMHMKASHSADPSGSGIVGPTRRHIITRLNKASGYAKQLVALLQDQAISHATDVDLLEARGYLAMLLGALFMERRKWEQCLQSYSEARIIYSALSQKEKNEAYRDLTSATIDPSLRYAAYQLKLPRTKPLPSLAIEHFPSDPDVRAEVEKFDSKCLTADVAGMTKVADGEVQQLPDNITWRSHSVPIADASIAQALAAASAAESHLSAWLSDVTNLSASPKEKAAAYDSVILASQDAVDATKTALDELTGEGVDRGDRRIQALQVTRTAVNYSAVGWRVGRNRVLCGEQDGLVPETKQGIVAHGVDRLQQGTGKKQLRLRENVALYDSTLRSLDFVHELPGVAGDSEFVRELDAKRNYFRALRCLAIGRSHSLQGKSKNALALYSKALDLASASQSGSTSATQATGPPKLDVSSAQIHTLEATLQGIVAQYRGLVTLEKLSETKHDTSRFQLPLIERMDEYVANGLDLTNLVPFPPKMQPIPVKPIFLDVAYNYIQYPREGQGHMESESRSTDEKKEGRRGWFGFGR